MKKTYSGFFIWTTLVVFAVNDAKKSFTQTVEVDRLIDVLTDSNEKQKVLPVSKQMEYSLHYKISLKQLVGQNKASEIIGNAIFLLCMNTHDFNPDYFIEPTRDMQFTGDAHDSLVSFTIKCIKKMRRTGATRFIVLGVPPLGSTPHLSRHYWVDLQEHVLKVLAMLHYLFIRRFELQLPPSKHH